ncbi:MAG: hypothetical protein K2W88_15155 [Pararheinheimera sp.]|nr:hypothetical protein [Rheinheimera sp.]
MSHKSVYLSKSVEAGLQARLGQDGATHTKMINQALAEWLALHEAGQVASLTYSGSQWTATLNDGAQLCSEDPQELLKQLKE